MNGLFATSKKSLPFSLPFFMPLPVSTEAASILRSKTPVVTSVDGNVRVASHLLNVPLIATDASTSNLTVLCTGVISYTGPCACASDGSSTATATRQRMDNRMGSFPDYKQLYNAASPIFSLVLRRTV